MKKMKIAIIDDRINNSYLDNNIIVKNYIVNSGSLEKEFSSNNSDLTHGTICALIFSYYCNVNFEIIGIKILDSKTSSCRSNYLQIALNWCLDNDVKIINLSLGSNYFKDKIILSNIIERLVNKNVFIVSAHNNNNILTYPASFNGVIGVRVDRYNIIENFSYIESNFNNIEIIASIKNNIIRAYNNEDIFIGDSNSYAAPYISALVANLIYNKSMSIIKLKEYFISNSDFTENYKYILNNYNSKYTISSIMGIKSPIVLILYDELDIIINHIEKINMSLFNDGYNAINIFENIIDSKLSNDLLNNIYTNNIDNDFILNTYNIYLPDIILLISNTIYKNFDIIINFNKYLKKYEVYFDSNIDTDEIYKYIINSFR